MPAVDGSMAPYAPLPISGVRRPVARREGNPRGRVSAQNLFVWLSSDPCNGPFHRLAEVAKPPIRSQHLAVSAHGDAVDLLVEVLDTFSRLSSTSSGSCCALCRASVDYFLASTARSRDGSIASQWCPQLNWRLLQLSLLRRTVGWPRVIRELLKPTPQSTSRQHTPALLRHYPWMARNVSLSLNNSLQ